MVFGLGKTTTDGDGESIKDSNTANFVKDVLEASRKVPVLVDFWAPWCGPCKQLTPLLEKVVRARKGKIKLVKINIDESPAIAGQLRVQSVPTVYAFRDGRPLDGFMGAQPESQINAFVDRLLGDEGAEDAAAALEAAEAALAANDLQRAAEIYAALLQDEPQNVAALAGLAQCYLKSGDIARAEQTIGLVPPDRKDAAPVASVRAALALARNAAKAGDAAKLEAKVKATPSDHQARLDYALALAAGGRKTEALDQLLEVVRRDRKWNDEAARKQLVQLFDAWGPKDPATLEGRRRLSSILFS
jgi:putative thioredoxin